MAFLNFRNLNMKNNKITSKYKTLYLIIINQGGFVHDKLYILNKDNKSSYPGYWDKTGNYGFILDDLDGQSEYFGLNKNDGCWEFIASNKKEAETFLAGALAAKEFIKNFVA